MTYNVFSGTLNPTQSTRPVATTLATMMLVMWPELARVVVWWCCSAEVSPTDKATFGELCQVRS